MKRLTTLAMVLVLAATLFASGCSPSVRAAAPTTSRTELRVSAATTLKRAFEEMEPAFEAANPGVDVVFNFGASGVLQKQIEAGAPCDVFASASPKQVDALVSGGYVSAEDTATFCGNEVAIVVRSWFPPATPRALAVRRTSPGSTGSPPATPRRHRTARRRRSG
ncbi:MAG: molybdate ABC transporter substrate-binding protein [Actinobacteria bacterium HGW-Actinobacteria-1]|nr:MAG: molybdate ABC transporter substrate-binding protein [Actinobacteria bacterium HGW-Actinobacteria-1]